MGSEATPLPLYPPGMCRVSHCKVVGWSSQTFCMFGRRENSLSQSRFRTPGPSSPQGVAMPTELSQTLRIPITPEFTAIVSGHGKTRAYLNRFKIIDDPMCPCNEGEQTVEHLIYVCSILEQKKFKDQDI